MSLSKQILNDLRRKLLSEFDRNFERKAFFNDSWPATKIKRNTGSLMMRSGALRRGTNAKIEGEIIRFENSQPYATLMNNGGTITVTMKMKKYFWFKHYQALGNIKSKKEGTVTALSQRNIRYSGEAANWKKLALAPIGSKFKVDKRQFIGWTTQLEPLVEQVIDKNVSQFIKDKASFFFKKRK